MKKVLLSVGEELLSAVDEYCKKYKYERSEFFRSLLRERVYFDTQKVIPPALVNKAKEAELQLEQAKQKTLKIVSSPLSSKGKGGLYSFCPKHSTFYASCGCEPK